MGRNKKVNGWDEIDGRMAFILPNTMLEHPNFQRCSGYAIKLLLDLGRQFHGYDNGYLCCSWSLMKDKGWRSAHTVQRAMLELEHYRLILRTQQGGRNRPNLHALSWRNIAEKKGRPLDMAPTVTPPNSWKEDGIPDFVTPRPKLKRAA